MKSKAYPTGKSSTKTTGKTAVGKAVVLRSKVSFKGKVFSGSHDTTCITSSQIYAQSTMQRHRMIYSALSDELSQGLHALSLNTKTAEEILNTSETQSTNLNDN